MYATRPEVEFPHWQDTDARRNEKVIDVSTDNGEACRLVATATATGLDIRATQPRGSVRISNDAHWLPVPPATATPTAEHVTPQPLPAVAPPVIPPLAWAWAAVGDGTPGVPPVDLAALRAENETLRTKLAAYEQGEARAWVLYDGEGFAEDPDLDSRPGGWPYPVCVVVGAAEDAQREADQRNLDRLSTAGALTPERVVRVANDHPPTGEYEHVDGLPIVWCTR